VRKVAATREVRSRNDKQIDWRTIGAMHKSLPRRVANRVLHIMAQFAPGCTTLRPLLHKMRGVKIYGTVFIGDQVYIENEYPELVELHDGVQIVVRSILMCHLRGTGGILIERNVWIGPNCVIAAPVGRTLTIGEGSVVAASSVVTQDVPKATFVGGSPAKPIARVTVPMTMYADYDEFKKGLLPL